MDTRKIAVIGFGFSGLMVTAQLVRTAPPATTVYVIAEDLRGLGVAYSTQSAVHLLNVPAIRMGAFADDSEGFFQWLGTSEAVLAKQRLGLKTAYQAGDFVPRALYGAYLNDIWRQTQLLAVERGVMLQLVETTATAISDASSGLAVLTARGDAIAVDRVVLATGNENKPVMRELPISMVVQDPWAPGVFDGAAEWASPVLLMGVGLTAVDTVLSLRQGGYAGEIIAFSRHGWWPMVHASANSIFSFDKDELFSQPSLAALMRYVRQKIVAQGEWRPVVDALRPHKHALWQSLTTREQKRFLSRLLTVWNVHRHRMAPHIAATLREEIMRGTLRVQASHRYEARVENGAPVVTLYEGGMAQEIRPSRIINCTGPQQVIEKSANTVLRQALADGLIEPHATGLGIATDPQLRAWGAAYPSIYVMGSLATGQLLESTAVPELRAQAALVAQSVLSDA